MSNPSDVSMVKRRDQLIGQIQQIIERQTGTVPLSIDQHIALQEAIAHFTVDVLKDEIERLSHEAR